MDGEKRFRVYENVGPPPANAGRKTRWGDLPLDAIGVNGLIEMPMESPQVESQIHAIRSYAWRMAKKLDKRFSVRKTEYGIGIWRTE
jgi:hypothetical protein|tara:strand:+ start:2344 stop:2604 length:261 start_codon:yes stop_codon:yes gene_type:complete